ncbi:UDP-N-acetylmuramate--L-alanine ligase [Candidatus Omnitrophota bacterium]
MFKHIHLIGIGGIGMSAVAQLLLKQGVKISGCDLKENDLVRSLVQDGVSIWAEHHPRHLESVDTLVYSSAITQDNPEIVEAKRRGIRLMRRAEILAYLMRDKRVITVTGMHGKTTTASLISFLFSQAGMLPTVAVGGILHNLGANAILGDGRFFIAEADESDGSFLCYQPDYSVITNIDYEHMDYYRDFGSILAAFRRFINQTRENGCLFYWQDDPHLAGLLKGYKNRTISFGLNQDADICALNIKAKAFVSEFDCLMKGEFISRFKVGLGGRHNILNSLPAIALAKELGIDIEFVKSALSNYKGTRRRMQIKFESRDYLVIDDYGHHPTEIKATLEAARLLNAPRLLVVFQPHRYTRTKLLLDSFADCFDLADRVIITDIYSAGEPEIKGINGYSICEKMKSENRKKAIYLPKADILNAVFDTINPGDVVIFLGAGDITKISDEFAEILERQVKEERAVSQTYQF